MHQIAVVLLLCWALPSAWAADIGVVGNWTELVDQNDLVAGAGSDLRSPIESAAAQATLDISATAGGNWTVKVSKSDLDWPAGVSVAVRRTSDGSGSGGISGGTTYLALTGTEQVLFSGSGDRSGIQLQLKTEGLTVGAAPNSYSTTISYRIE